MRAINKTSNKVNVVEPFKNLFTQGMVCHETYKDENGNWLYPDEIEKDEKNNFIKKNDKSKIIVVLRNLCLNQKKIQSIQRK